MTGRRFGPNETVDFVVVGSGAAGGVMARELSRAGLTVLVLEQGPRFTAADFGHDEFDTWLNLGLSNKLETNPQTFRSSASEPARRVRDFPAAWYAPMVGGSSNHFTGNFWRFHEEDFDERSRLGAMPGTTFDDWPITYAELEPYYTKVEWDVGVSGLAAASPFDPPRSKPYPMPPLPVKSSGVLFERGARKLGLHPFPAPMAIASVPYHDRPACQHCGFCIGYGCEMRAKSSALYTTLPEAEATGNCEIRPSSYVARIETGPAGRVTGVAYFDAQRRERFQKARAVAVCANGAESARLLLMSADAKHPDGLANSSGMVGRSLMFNTYAQVHALFEHELNEFKSVQVTRILHDFYETDPKRGFYGGGGLDARSGPMPIVWGA
ncbi:MAG TPA: GMC family oxidoreductase, partial [Steroidobacteraceae bacterium]|nr:GMC family oxidoreductase [Steroidobacteraceae bacterium]